jgi:hypothetical protein
MAWQNGMVWHSMRETARGAGEAGAAIYDECLFHLQGAVRLAEAPAAKIPAPLRRLGHARFEALARTARAAIPSRLRQALGTWMLDDWRLGWHSEAMRTDSASLLSDLDAFIETLRGRGRA